MKGSAVYASSCREYKVSAKSTMYISHCVFVYDNKHDYNIYLPKNNIHVAGQISLHFLALLTKWT